MQKQCDYIFKVVLFGDSEVGKSSLLFRFADDSFNKQFSPTIGADFRIKNLNCQNKEVKLQIWDTSGQQRFRNTVSAYYKGVVGFLIIFDITNRQSFINASKWIEEIKQHAIKEAIFVLVGTKSDMENKREVLTAEAYNLASQLNIPFFETSSLDQQNIEWPFIKLTQELLQKYTKIVK